MPSYHLFIDTNIAFLSESRGHTHTHTHTHSGREDREGIQERERVTA